MKQINQATLRRIISVGMLLILIILFAILSGSSFTNFPNFMLILRDASVVGIVGVGVTYVIITAGIDLSTSGMMALVGMVMANIYRYTLLPIPVMMLAGIAVGLLAGLINGLIVGKLHVPEFIGTLATQSIFRALNYIIAVRSETGGITSQPMNVSSYTFWGGTIGPVYIVTIAMLIFIVVGQIVLKYTRYGTSLYCVGANKKASTLSGIDVEKVQVIAYIIVGFCVSIGTIFQTANIASTNAQLAEGFEFNPIAAAVVGGVALSGGSGDVVGMCIGALFMASLDNGVRKLGINPSYQYIIKGVILILVVMFDAVYKKRMDRIAKEQGAKEGTE